MSWLGERVLRNLWRLSRRKSSSSADGQRENDPEAYIRWQFSTSPRLFALYPSFDPKGKTILEIGCGMGGRAAWLAASGAKRVVGIDINQAEIEIAQRLCPALFPETVGRLEYLASAEDAHLPLGEFDVVLLVDAMEHVVSPPNMKKLAHHYTATGG